MDSFINSCFFTFFLFSLTNAVVLIFWFLFVGSALALDHPPLEPIEPDGAPQKPPPGKQSKPLRRASCSLATGGEPVNGHARRGSVPLSCGTAPRSLPNVEQTIEEALEAAEEATAHSCKGALVAGIGGAKASSTFYVSYDDE